ncbi:MAG TPA: hypothetical protein VF477_04010 [Mycobacterium sp.]
MARRTLTFAIALLSGYLAFALLPLASIRHEPIPFKVVAILLLVIACGARWFFSTLNIGLNSEARRTDGEFPSSSDESLAESCEQAFQSRITVDEFEQLLETVSDPGGVVLRITETAVLGGRDFSTTVKRTVVPPLDPYPEKIYIPVLKPRRGELIDNFRVVVDGAPARTLSHRETIGALLAITRTLISQSCVGCPFPGELWRLLIRDVVLSDSPTPESQRTLVLDQLRTLEKSKASTSEAELIARAVLWRLVIDLFKTYVIIAVVPIDGESVKVETSYTRRRDVYKVLGGKPFLIRWWQWCHIQIQLLFGLAVRSDQYMLTQATEAQSYHFRAEAPEGMYVYDVKTDLVDVQAPSHGRSLDLAALARPVSPDWQASDTRGLGHLHAYGRDLDVWLNRSDDNGNSSATNRRNAVLNFELRERPPGVMFVVGLMSVYVALLSIGIAIGYDVVFGQYSSGYVNALPSTTPSNPDSSPWPTVLFGVPAIVSGWVVARFTAETVRLVSISTIAVTTWAIANTVYAVALSAVTISKPMHPVQGWFGIPLWQPAWSLLVVSSTACTVMAVLLLALRVRRFSRRVRGKAPWVGAED